MRGSLWPPRVKLLTIFLLVLGSVFFFNGLNLWATATRYEALGPGGFPVIFSAVWVVGAVIFSIFEVIKPQKVPSYKINISDIRTIRGVLVISGAFLYILVVGEIGFIIASLIYLVVSMLVLGATKKVKILTGIILATIIICSIYFAYTLVFRIPLPGEF